MSKVLKIKTEPESRIEIEKGLPIPAKRPGPMSKYPFSAMEIGDSFFVATSRQSLSKSVHTARKRLGRRFTCRAEPGGYRVWRIED